MPDVSPNELGGRGLFFKCSDTATLFSKDSPRDKENDSQVRQNNNTNVQII